MFPLKACIKRFRNALPKIRHAGQQILVDKNIINEANLLLKFLAAWSTGEGVIVSTCIGHGCNNRCIKLGIWMFLAGTLVFTGLSSKSNKSK